MKLDIFKESLLGINNYKELISGSNQFVKQCACANFLYMIILLWERYCDSVMLTNNGAQLNIHFRVGAKQLNCSPMALLFTRNLSCKLISLASHDLSVQVRVLSPDLHLPAQPARETETHYHWSLRSTTTEGGAKEISPSLLKNEAL